MQVNHAVPVLVVDDTPAMAAIVAAVARRAGFRDVDSVGSAREALECMATRGYGLVISDLEMPEIGGLELLKRIRQQEEWRNLPVLMISAHRRADYVAAAASRGVTCFMVKPFSLQQLKEKIRRISLPSI